jgi:hypothetical protein
MANSSSSPLDRTGQENGIHWRTQFVRDENIVRLSATHGDVTQTDTYTLLHLSVFSLDFIDANEINQRLERLIATVSSLTTTRP